MNSTSDPSSPEHSSEPPADSPAASEGSPEQRRAARIRIGSQRYGAPVPKAVPHPVLQPPAPAHEKATDSAPATDVTERGTAGTDAVASEAAASAVEVDSPGRAVETSIDRPASETPAGDKPNQPRALRAAPEQQPSRHYPPPNIRDRLTPELELEYLEALGGKSIDDVIAHQQPAVVAELEPESRQRGTVISIHRDDVFVDLGGRQQGVVSLRNFAEAPEVGATLDVVVSRFNAPEGIYELTLPGGAIEVGDWSEVTEGIIVEARITGSNKGGLECEVSRLRGFIPASQISMYRVEDLEQFVGQTFKCVVTEANPEKRNLVLSHRAVMEREKAESKEKLLAELAPGQVREGTVRSLQDFGAFVDLGGIDGLIHISQISWDRIKHPSEVLELGQKVKVKINKIDPQTGKISLALRDLSENPWEHAARDFPIKSRVHGKVTRLTDFGAFVRVGPGVEGLVHISELSYKRVFRVSDVLSEGQEVDVQVLSVDAENQRISLSLKALEAKAQPAPEEDETPAEEPQSPATPPKKRKTPLKGGIGGPPTGEKFGLKW